jgi:hypothetical protein
LRLLYPSDLVAPLPRRFDRAILARLERGWSRHPNRDNRWAWRLLAGREPAGSEGDPPSAAPDRIEFLCADARSYLVSCAPAEFDGISLSNVLDGLPREHGPSLLTAASRAAKPGGRIVVRSFREPGEPAASAWAERDRSPLWRAIEVLEVRADGRAMPLSP